MDPKSFHRLVLAELMQRLNEAVESAATEYTTAKQRYEAAEAQLQRARANKQAFVDFVNANRPTEGGNG